MGVLSRRQPVGIFSDDSKAAAFGLLPGALPGGWGTPPTRGTPEYLRAYSQMPWLRAVVGRIATAVANVEWRLYVAKGKKEPKARSDASVRKIQRAPMKERRLLLKSLMDVGDLQPVLDNPLLTLLKDANEFHTGFSMRKVTQLHIDIVGDAFWLKERDGQGTPTAVWPVPPHWIVSTPTPTFRFFRVSFRAWRGLIPDTEFTWFSDIDPLNPYARGTGSAMALGDELETDEYAARHSKAFFYNQAMPPLVIYPKGPNGVSPPNMKRLEEQWMSQSQGFFRTARPFFMNREVGIEKMDQNFRALQFTQLREFERNTVLQHFGMPPEILGVLEHSNRSTIDSADFFTGKYLVEPRAEFLRQVMQERLVPEYDDRLILDYAPIVEEDNGRQLEAAKAQPGALTVDEWRAMMGHPPMDDEAQGALHMVPALTVIQPLEPAPPKAPVVGVSPSSGSGGTGAPSAPAVPSTPPKARRMDLDWEDNVSASIEAGDVPLAETIAKLSTVAPDNLPRPSAAASRFEAALGRSLVRAWKDYQQTVSLAALEAGLEASGVHGDLVAAIDPHALGKAQSAVLRPVLEACVLRGAEVGASALQKLGVRVRRSVPTQKLEQAVDFNAVNPLATHWAEEHAAALVMAAADIREVIRLLVAESNESGITVQELARTLRGVIGLRPDQVAAVANLEKRLAADAAVSVEQRIARVARYAEAQLRARAMLIARTETISMVARGQQLLWDQAIRQGILQPKQFLKVWIVADDDRLCDECEEVDGEEVGIDEDFSNGVDQPPGHPACRCATGLVEAKEKSAKAPGLPPVTVHVNPPITIQNLPSPAPARASVTRTLQYDDQGRISGMTETEGVAR